MRSLRRVPALVLGSALALTACSPSDDEVSDAVGSLPGVVSAEPSCFEFRCTVDIEAEADASADELAQMLTAARAVDDADDIEVSLTTDVPGDVPGGVSARVDVDASPAAEDAVIGALLAWAATAAADGLTGLEVERGSADRIRVTGSTADGTSAWPLAGRAWALADDLAGAELAFTRPERLAQQSVGTTGPFPDESVALAEELEARDGPVADAVTGVVITDDRFLVGTISREAAEDLRAALRDDTRLAGRSLEVVVSTNVLMAAAGGQEPGTSQRLEPVLAALEGQPAVLFATILGSSVEVQVGDLRSAPALVERVRRRAGAAFVDTTLVLVDDSTGRLEITSGGDDAVLDLVTSLLDTPGLAEVVLEQDVEPDPDRAAVALSMTVRQPGRGTGSAPPVGPEVTRLARLLATTPGTAQSYALGVTVEDADGRSATAGWRVERTAGGLVLGEVNGTAERQAEITAAWERGAG